MDNEQEIQAAREKLAARFANATQIGGKGKDDPPALLKQYQLLLQFRHPEKKEEAC